MTALNYNSFAPTRPNLGLPFYQNFKYFLCFGNAWHSYSSPKLLPAGLRLFAMDFALSTLDAIFRFLLHTVDNG